MSNGFGNNVFHSSVERKVKTENPCFIFRTKYLRVDQVKVVEDSLLKNFTWFTLEYLDSFAVLWVVHTKIFLSFIKLHFYKKVNPTNNLTFCFLRTFFWVPIPVNQYEICSACSPGKRYDTWYMLFGIFPQMSHRPKFWHAYMIMHSHFMVIVEPWCWLLIYGMFHISINTMLIIRKELTSSYSQ